MGVLPRFGQLYKMHETQPVLLWKVNINMSFLENEIIELLRTCDAFMAVIQFSSVAQSCPTLVPKFMSIELVMPSNHLILYCSLLLLPSVIPSIRVFSNESPLHIGSQSIGVSFPFGSVHFSISLETSSLNHGLCRRRLVSIQVFGNFLCCSVTQSCPALCYPMDCSMLGFPVIYHLP